MAINASISWDEENSPKAFYGFWAASELVLFVLAILIQAHQIHSLAFARPGSSSASRAFGLFFIVLLVSTLGLYLNLIVNGIWHRNPDAVDDQIDEEPSGLEDIGLGGGEPGIKRAEPGPPALFSHSILKNPDPVVTRDYIQWKRMGLATLAAGGLALSFIYTFSI